MRWIYLTPIILAGCESLSPFENPANKNVIPQSQLSPASHASAARLDKVGKQILSTNPFLATAPAFCFVGSKEPEMFHQNAEAVFVSEGLIQACRSEDELAGMLCVELAKITVEYRNLGRMGLAEPDTSLPGPKVEIDPEEADLGGGNTVGQSSEPTKRLKALPQTNVMVLAAELHKNASYKPEAFDSIKPLLLKAENSSNTAKQLSGSSTVPKWSR